MLGVIPISTTRIAGIADKVLYVTGIFFLMFCFQKTYYTGIFFIDYRYTYVNMVIVFLLGVVFTAAYYLRRSDLIFVGRVVHAMSAAVVISFVVYRIFLRDWVLHHFEYITDDYHLIFCALCLASIMITASAARISGRVDDDSFVRFYRDFIKGAVWLFLLFFAFIYFINRSGDIVYVTNRIPFHGELARVFSEGAGSYVLLHFIVNVVFFSVFAVLVMSFTRYGSVFFGTAVPSVVSVFMEIYQYCTDSGDADIDDVIMNVAGALLGVLVYQLIIKKLLAKDCRTRSKKL